jgi:hypothetical protein
VIFAVPGKAKCVWADAGFRVRDDGRLIVTVPDLGSGEWLASVLVVTPTGAALTLPARAAGNSPDGAPAGPGDAGVFFVAPGATLTPPQGATIVVDRGAWARGADGSLVVVRAGGGLERAKANCLVIRETPRPQPRDLVVTPVLDVPAVNASFVDSLFRYSGNEYERS